MRKCSYAAVKIALAPEWLAALRFSVVLIRGSEEFAILYSFYMWHYYKGQRKGIWRVLLLSDTPYLLQLNPWPFWHPTTASFTKPPGMTLLPGSGGCTSREGLMMAQCKCYFKFVFFLPLWCLPISSMYFHSTVICFCVWQGISVCCLVQELVLRMCSDSGDSRRKRPEMNLQLKPNSWLPSSWCQFLWSSEMCSPDTTMYWLHGNSWNALEK